MRLGTLIALIVGLISGVIAVGLYSRTVKRR